MGFDTSSSLVLFELVDLQVFTVKNQNNLFLECEGASVSIRIGALYTVTS